jgi:hypothetical protein
MSEGVTLDISGDDDADVIRGLAFSTVATVATVATHVCVFLRFNERLLEAILGIETLATTTKPDDKQKIFEPKASSPLCQLSDLFPVHRIRFATPAKSGRAGTVTGLELLKIGNLSSAATQRLADNRSIQVGVAEGLS